ncbi:hypothetical protein EDD57_1604 [Baia soyae]|uniref:Uncharacterized protein n=1 Tax=Baia soyae TaxID=1544746 RepID=A0A4R2RDK8_9BACL|nr:hypothetical protein EDD57_1604 [Baia soyae]
MMIKSTISGLCTLSVVSLLSLLSPHANTNYDEQSFAKSVDITAKDSMYLYGEPVHM